MRAGDLVSPKVSHDLSIKYAHSTADQVETKRTQVQHDLWLAEQRLNLAQREVKKRIGNKQYIDQASREYENRVREQQEARGRWDVFNDYIQATPKFDIVIPQDGEDLYEVTIGSQVVENHILRYDASVLQFEFSNLVSFFSRASLATS